MELTLRLNADGSAMITTVRRADDALDNLGDGADRANARVSNLSGGLSRVASRVLALTGLGGVLAGAFSMGQIINAQREFDVLNAQLITATGSAREAAKAFDDLTKFAATTPYALAQSVQGFTQLKNLGLDPSMESMQSYGNFAAAMGKGLSQMIEAVADASTMEFERLKEFGIKAKQSQTEIAFTFQGVTTTVGRNADEIQKYLLSIGNTQFADAMANRAKTLDGAISNLGDSFNMLKLRIAQSGLGDMAKDIIVRMSSVIQTLADNVGLLASAFRPLMAILAGWAAYRYLPGLIAGIATATRAWATAEALLNAQLGAGLILGYIKNIKIFKGTISGTVSALSSLKGAIGVASAAFAGWEIGKWAYDNFTVVRSVSYDVVVTLIDHWDGLVTWLAQAFNSIMAGWAMVSGAIEKRARALYTAVGMVWNGIKAGFAKMGVKLVTTAKNIFTFIGGGFADLSANIAKAMSWALTKVKDGLSGLSNFSVMGNNTPLKL